MNFLFTLVSAECQKIRKSKVFIISIISILLLPLVCGLFMLIAMYPDLAQKSGVITQKAKVLSAADWPSYLGLFSQMISIGGIILFGFVTSWTFGREYSDGTAKDLLALPLPRGMVIAAKFISVAVWSIFLAAASLLLTTLLGFLISVPGFDFHMYLTNISLYVICTLMVIVLSAPIAFFACWGKGYLPPLGFLVFALFVGNITAAMGHGVYFVFHRFNRSNFNICMVEIRRSEMIFKNIKGSFRKSKPYPMLQMDRICRNRVSNIINKFRKVWRLAQNGALYCNCNCNNKSDIG